MVEPESDRQEEAAMPNRMKVSQILEAGKVALAAGIAAEARHREQVRVVLAEARFLRTHLPQAPRDELRTSIEVMLRRVDQARESHRRQNWTIARLQELLHRAGRCRTHPDLPARILIDHWMIVGMEFRSLHWRFSRSAVAVAGTGSGRMR
jgi:hypothetical protein